MLVIWVEGGQSGGNNLDFVLRAAGCSTGSSGKINIWSLQDGTLANTYVGSGGVQDVCWLSDHGLAVCFSRSKVSDLRIHGCHFQM